MIVPTLFVAAMLIAGVNSPARSGVSVNTHPAVIVDNEGVLRRADTGAEVSYYGTNYTAPFAHAYRALGYLGVDRKEAIKRDVYHFARLGFNGFRLHLWDVELSDAEGNLLENDHLDLLDFLLAELEKRGIDIVLTAQTDFGNGYPERNIDTGAFAYDYDKCEIHENPHAQKAQENYLRQLASHVNPYTGLSYAKDPAIIAMEINNEPCHSGTPGQVTAYINRMVTALKKAGFNKPILYNVSHNPDVTEAYYNADIQGTTYQWYPTGLVAGHERKGNFLPFVDDYAIPWADSMKNYNKLARFVYEFDPGDVLTSNLYPAIAREFREKGFQWVTQFAYDPTDMARFNTEYQTHFLNLAYTPAKAISMLIASQVMQEVPRGADYGKYPDNKNFGHTSLYESQGGISLYNSPSDYYHTGDIDVEPVYIDSLAKVAGVGNSPVVTYPGTGAYFLDRLDERHWRLEVMPDVVITEDPFAKPSLNREVARIIYAEHPMTIALPSLADDFSYVGINEGNSREGKAMDATMRVYPGVYLLSDDTPETDKWSGVTPFGAESASAPLGNMLLGEFVAPAPSEGALGLRALPTATHLPAGSPLAVSARVAAPAGVDSVTVYPGDVNFWRTDNKLYPMQQVSGKPYEWNVEIMSPRYSGDYTYRITAWSNGEALTFPGAIPGTPLDWDFPDDTPYYSVTLYNEGEPVLLMGAGMEGRIESGSVPDGEGAWLREKKADFNGPGTISVDFTPGKEDVRAVVRSYIADTPLAGDTLELILDGMPAGVRTIEVGLVGSDGVSHTEELPVESLVACADGTYRAEIPVSRLKVSPTWLLPAAYPAFMNRSFDGTDKEAVLTDAESAVITLSGLKKDTPVNFVLRALLIK